MIDIYQLDDPYQLVEDGTWTLDKYFSMAEAVAHDLNGNNEIDKDDCFGAALAFSTQEAFMLGCDVRYSRHDDEKIEATIMTERTVTALEKIDKFMKTKSVVMMDGDYSDGVTNVYFNVFIPTLGDNRCLFYSNTLLSAMNMRSMDVDFGVLPMPKYDEQQKTYANSPNTWFTDNVIIPSTNADLERTGAVIEAMGYYSAQYVTPAFIDNVVMNKTIRDEKSAEMINLVYDTITYDVAQIFNWGGITDTMYVIYFSDGQSYSSVYASYKSAIDKAIEKATAEFKGE